MAHCHMYDIKGFQFSLDNCREGGELRMCAVCDSSTHNFWVKGKRIRPFTCEVHGRWMTGEWVLSNYPNLDNSNVDQWTPRVWVCETHCDPQAFKRMQEEEERRKRLEEKRRTEERKERLRAQDAGAKPTQIESIGEEPWDARKVVVIALMMVLIIAVIRRPFRLPIGYPIRYINLDLGMVGIVFSALAFGPWVGALVGGLSMAIASIVFGSTRAVISILFCGLQGYVVGQITRKDVRIRKLVLAGFVSAVIGISNLVLFWVIHNLNPGTMLLLSIVTERVVTSALGVLLYLVAQRIYLFLKRES